MSRAPINIGELPKPGQLLNIADDLVTVVSAIASDDAVDLVVRSSNGNLVDRSVSLDVLAAAILPENDGRGNSTNALAGLWGRWMQYVSPRLRSAALATRSLKPFAHQDEAVFDQMLPQPQLRFLLADEPGTGKTIMTGMYVVEARRRGLIPGPSVIIVPAHLVQKWREELEDFFGIYSGLLTPEIARDPKDLDPRVDVWIASLDLFTHNPEIRRKIAGGRASWSLAVFDEAHRLTPTSRYLSSAQELAVRCHHLLLLTATPHRGKEHFFRGLCNLLDSELYSWNADANEDDYSDHLRPSKLSFLRRMKEELKDRDGSPLFPRRFAETVPVALGELEQSAYDAVMDYAQTWYGENSTLALSIYGKRAASSLIAAEATLQRRLDALSGSEGKRGLKQMPDSMAEGLQGTHSFSAAFENPEDLAAAEDVVVTAKTRDRPAEIEAVRRLLEQIHAAIDLGGTPAKWITAEGLIAKHGVKPGTGQLLVFTEFSDTARWLTQRFTDAGYSAETLEGAVDHRMRHALQRRFLNKEFQILVSTDAGGEGINLQSAHVMIDWDIPWSLVRLEQRMGRLHRIGQKHDVYVYHLVAPQTREGRVQAVMLNNLEAAADSLGGRIFDLLDATVARSSPGFDFARALAQAQAEPNVDIQIPDVAALKRAGEALVNEDKYLRTKVDQNAAESRFRQDRLEAINPVIVNAFIDAVAQARGWRVGPGPALGIRRLQSKTSLPKSFGLANSILIAADGQDVEQAQSANAALGNVAVLGPSEEAFKDLVDIALKIGRPDLLRGCQVIDTGSITDYTLLIYEAEIRMNDGIRQVPRPAPLLIRWSGAGAFEIGWESLMSLKPTNDTGASVDCPSPAQLVDGTNEARAALKREVQRQKDERLSWVKKARTQLNEYEDRFNEEIEDLPGAERQSRRFQFQARKRERIEQLAEIEDIQATAARLVGWAHVRAGISLDQLGYSPDAEKVAIGRVIAELEALEYAIDDRQTAGVGYDLLARNRKTGDQRCVEVKGFTEAMGAVWLEQNEWAQALQRRDDYWLYVVDQCATQAAVRIRVQNPAEVFGAGASKIQRFQIKLSQLKDQVQQK
jgi:superfamily II DNA or RNA helicase